MSYESAKKAKEFYKVDEDTLRRWAKAGKINFFTTDGGHRRYLCKHEAKENEERKKIIYARVSSSKQENDLENQVNFLRERYPNHEIVKDIGSGINYQRKGFKTILESLFRGNIEEVVVASGDRFSRLGFEFFEWMFAKHNSKLISVTKEFERSSDEELAENLMEIITVFSAKYYGKRKYNSHKEDKDLPE